MAIAAINEIDTEAVTSVVVVVVSNKAVGGRAVVGLETLQRTPTPQASKRLARLHDNPAEPGTAAVGAAPPGKDRKGTPTFDITDRDASGEGIMAGCESTVTKSR